MTSSELVELAPLSVTSRQGELSVRLRVSPKAQRARIVVGPQRPLELVVPEGTSLDEAQEFLAEKRLWIEEKVARSQEIATRPAKLGLDQANTAWLLGARVDVQVQRTGAPTAIANLIAPTTLAVKGAIGEQQAEGAIERWYRREARARFRAAVGREVTRVKLPAPTGIAIRDAKTRWGSCSSRGNLSFSWRLLLAPEEVGDYVVIHELCHLVEASHSRAFWRLLETAMPGWQGHDRWLKEHGRELREWRPILVS